MTVAAASTCRQKHGVVLAKGRRVLAVAVNTYRNNPRVVSDPSTQSTYHAEWNAIKQLKDVDLSDVTLYSARVNREGKPMLAKPCKACESLIEMFEIKRVYYT